MIEVLNVFGYYYFSIDFIVFEDNQCLCVVVILGEVICLSEVDIVICGEVEGDCDF